MTTDKARGKGLIKSQPRAILSKVVIVLRHIDVNANEVKMRLFFLSVLSVLLLSTQAISQARELCPDTAVSLPPFELDDKYLNLAGQGSTWSFGSSAFVCVDQDKINVVSLELHTNRTLDCQELLAAGADGLGHTFFFDKKPYQFWFLVNPERSPRSFEFGVYGGGNVQYYWVDTGVEICSS